MAKRKAKYVMTPARRAALRKAQLTSARKRHANRMVTVYHYTSPHAARSIIRQQTLRPSRVHRYPRSDTTLVYVLRRKSKYYDKTFPKSAITRKSALIKTRVPLSSVMRDPDDARFMTTKMATRAKYKPAKAYAVKREDIFGRKLERVY
jgi:hypothetical protein